MSNPTTARADFAAWRERTRVNAFTADSHFRSLVHAYGRADESEAFEAFGA